MEPASGVERERLSGPWWSLRALSEQRRRLGARVAKRRHTNPRAGRGLPGAPRPAPTPPGRVASEGGESPPLLPPRSWDRPEPRRAFEDRPPPRLTFQAGQRWHGALPAARSSLLQSGERGGPACSRCPGWRARAGLGRLSPCRRVYIRPARGSPRRPRPPHPLPQPEPTFALSRPGQCGAFRRAMDTSDLFTSCKKGDVCRVRWGLGRGFRGAPGGPRVEKVRLARLGHDSPHPTSRWAGCW